MDTKASLQAALVPFRLPASLNSTWGVEMAQLYLYLQNLFAREEGQDLAEYGMLVALIAFIVIVAVTLFGDNLSTFFNSIAVTVAGW
jgi:pilus assembly protein Flp/PilA